MSLAARLARSSRLVQSVLVVSMLAGGAGCAQQVGEEADPSAATANAADAPDVTGTTSSALSTNLGGADPASFILDIAEGLVTGAIEKAIYGEEIDYERINKMFEDDLRKFADKEHVRDAGVHVTGTLLTLTQVLGSYDPNGAVNQNDVSILSQRVDRLNDDLASMRAEDAKKVGLRTYLWAATVQHAVLQTLVMIDKDHAVQHNTQLRIALHDHAGYVAGRVVEFKQDAVTRLGQISDCKYYSYPLSEGTYEWFDDQGANYGSDPAVVNGEGKDYCDVSNYRSDRARAWGVNAGSQSHTCDSTWYSFSEIKQTMSEHCVSARDSYRADMQTKLDSLNGFTADENLPDTRVLLQKWNDALAKLGGPVAQ